MPPSAVAWVAYWVMWLVSNWAARPAQPLVLALAAQQAVGARKGNRTEAALGGGLGSAGGSLLGGAVGGQTGSTVGAGLGRRGALGNHLGDDDRGGKKHRRHRHDQPSWTGPLTPIGSSGLEPAVHQHPFTASWHTGCYCLTCPCVKEPLPMNQELLWVLGLLAIVIVLFVINRPRMDVVALMVILPCRCWASSAWSRHWPASATRMWC